MYVLAYTGPVMHGDTVCAYTAHTAQWHAR